MDKGWSYVLRNDLCMLAEYYDEEDGSYYHEFCSTLNRHRVTRFPNEYHAKLAIKRVQAKGETGLLTVVTF